MTSSNNHQLARDFIAALSAGDVPDELLTPDMTLWTISSGTSSDKARFQAAIKMLASITDDAIVYDIVSLTAEGDRVVAEVKSRGTLINGETFENNHVFLLRVRDGKIAEVAEYMNPIVVREKIAPLLQQAMAKASR